MILHCLPIELQRKCSNHSVEKSDTYSTKIGVTIEGQGHTVWVQMRHPKTYLQIYGHIEEQRWWDKMFKRNNSELGIYRYSSFHLFLQNFCKFEILSMTLFYLIFNFYFNQTNILNYDHMCGFMHIYNVYNTYRFILFYIYMIHTYIHTYK